MQERIDFDEIILGKIRSITEFQAAGWVATSSNISPEEGFEVPLASGAHLSSLQPIGMMPQKWMRKPGSNRSKDKQKDNSTNTSQPMLSQTNQDAVGFGRHPAADDTAQLGLFQQCLTEKESENIPSTSKNDKKKAGPASKKRGNTSD